MSSCPAWLTRACTWVSRAEPHRKTSKPRRVRPRPAASRQSSPCRSSSHALTTSCGRAGHDVPGRRRPLFRGRRFLGRRGTGQRERPRGVVRGGRSGVCLRARSVRDRGRSRRVRNRLAACAAGADGDRRAASGARGISGPDRTARLARQCMDGSHPGHRTRVEAVCQLPREPPEGRRERSHRAPDPALPGIPAAHSHLSPVVV